MSGSVNKVIVLGRLGADPEVRSFDNGGKIVSIRVATSERWKDKQTGEMKERTEWHSVTIKNDALAEIAEKYLSKGSNVYLEGALQTRKWTAKDGSDRYSTEIILGPYKSQLTLLDSKSDREGRDGGERQDRTSDRNAKQAAKGGKTYDNSELDSDEIPF